MQGAGTLEAISMLLGSAQVFSSAVRDVLEESLLREATGGRLTFSQLKLLKLVALADTHTVGDVAAFLGISNTAASKAVDKLVRRRLVRRTEGHADRRESELSLSGDGRRLLTQYQCAKDLKLAELLGACASEQLSATADMLDRLSASIVAHSADPRRVCLQCGIYFREKCPLRDFVRRTCFYQMHRARKLGEPDIEGSGRTAL